MEIELMHEIRRFEVADAIAVQALAAAAPLAAQWSLQSYKGMLEAGHAAWVATGDGEKLSGFIVARTISGEAEILNLAVATDCRRSGIASALWNAALKNFAMTGVQRIFLEVRASNLAAIAFYRKHGFAKVGSRAGYYPATETGGGEAAVLMQKLVTGRNQLPT
jgi:ribosomal-protein-alanine acetyltransferase